MNLRALRSPRDTSYSPVNSILTCAVVAPFFTPMTVTLAAGGASDDTMLSTEPILPRHGVAVVAP